MFNWLAFCPYNNVHHIYRHTYTKTETTQRAEREKKREEVKNEKKRGVEGQEEKKRRGEEEEKKRRRRGKERRRREEEEEMFKETNKKRSLRVVSSARVDRIASFPDVGVFFFGTCRKAATFAGPNKVDALLTSSACLLPQRIVQQTRGSSTSHLYLGQQV